MTKLQQASLLLLDARTHTLSLTFLCFFGDLNGNLTGGKHVIVQNSQQTDRQTDRPVNGEMKGQGLISSVVDLFKRGNIYQSGQCLIDFKWTSRYLTTSLVFKFYLFSSFHSLSFSPDCVKSLIQLPLQVVSTEGRATLGKTKHRSGLWDWGQEQFVAIGVRQGF